MTAILADYSTVTINSDAELQALADTCPDEDEDDDDIECIDFQYPISFSELDNNGAVINTITVNNDSDLYDLIDDLDDYESIVINFPITIITFDGTLVTINNATELENQLEAAEDSCDEDDDYDYDDDDCDDCSITDIEQSLVDCVWTVEELERNDTDLNGTWTVEELEEENGEIELELESNDDELELVSNC